MTITGSDANRNCVVGYAFVAVPEGMISRIDHPTAERVFQVLYACIRRGWKNPPIRWLAAQVGRCYRQALRALDLLEEKGFIRIKRRRISATRNAPNEYQIVGVGDTHVTEKQKQKGLKTNTARPAGAAPSAFHLQWLQRTVAQLKEQLAFRRRRDNYRQKLEGEAQLAKVARVGVYDEAYEEAFQRRKLEREEQDREWRAVWESIEAKQRADHQR